MDNKLQLIRLINRLEGLVGALKMLALSLKIATGNEQNAVNSGIIYKFCEEDSGNFELNPKGQGYFLPNLR